MKTKLVSYYVMGCHIAGNTEKTVFERRYKKAAANICFINVQFTKTHIPGSIHIHKF